MIGNRYGKLVVLEEVEKLKGKRRFLCECDCGGTKVAVKGSLTNGLTTSCGCYHKERASEGKTTHGWSGTTTYSTWKSMKKRCNNENDSVYSFYGGRGIGYQESWEDFENFLADMGERPEGMTLDRIDVNGNYTKDNCRWATNEEQGLNKRPHTKSITGVVGVIPRSNGSFFASFKKRNLGTFRLLEDAVLARRYAEYLWKNGEWDQSLDNLSVRSKIKEHIEKVRKEFTDQQSMAMDIIEWAAKEYLKSD